MSESIVNNRIAGTRITVWDVLHHLENNWSHREIAELLRLSDEQVMAAVNYIAKHRDEVMKVHRQIEERNSRGNPPEVLAKLAAAKTKRLAWVKDRLQESKR